MSFNSYRLFRRAFGIFSLLCAVSFFLFYFNNYLLFEEKLSALAPHFDTLEYARYAIAEVIDFILPPLSALLLMPRLLTERAYKLYPAALLLSLSKLFYNLPYYYLYHIAVGYDSFESVMLTLPLSLLISLLSALYALGLAYLGLRVYKKRGTGIGDYANPAPHFSLSHPTCASVFSFVLAGFIITFAVKLVDAILFFVEYADSFRLGELFSVLGSFLYPLLYMLFTQWLCVHVHNRIIANRFYEEAEDGE